MQTTDTHKLNIVPFRYSSDWLYYPNVDMEYRFILGTRGRNPIIVIGLNPSTATPEQPDPTIKRVSAIASHNGYDSFVMLNLYAQRATIPGNLDVELNRELHGENLGILHALFHLLLKASLGLDITVRKLSLRNAKACVQIKLLVKKLRFKPQFCLTLESRIFPTSLSARCPQDNEASDTRQE